MFPIICRWKLVKHLDCFGDNKRTKDYKKYQVIFVLKPVVWLYSVYSIFHYGISEKTNKKSNGLNYTQTCLHQHANYLPYSFPSNWNILAFVVYFALLTLTCKHVYANYPSFSSFCWRQKWHLWFPRSDACLFGHPVHFDYQDFLSFTSDFSFQHFKAGKLSWWLIFNIKIIICL